MCAVKQDDSNNAKFRIVELLQNLEMWQLSTDFLAKASKTYYKTYYFIALQMVHFQRYKEAISLFTKASEMNPYFGAAKFHKAECLMQIQHFEEARAIYSSLLAFDMNNQLVKMSMIQLHQVIGDFSNYQLESSYVITAVDRYIHQFYRHQNCLNPYDPAHRSPIPQRSTFMHRISHSQAVQLGIINANLNYRKLQFL